MGRKTSAVERQTACGRRWSRGEQKEGATRVRTGCLLTAVVVSCRRLCWSASAAATTTVGWPTACGGGQWRRQRRRRRGHSHARSRPLSSQSGLRRAARVAAPIRSDDSDRRDDDARRLERSTTPLSCELRFRRRRQRVRRRRLKLVSSPRLALIAVATARRRARAIGFWRARNTRRSSAVAVVVAVVVTSPSCARPLLYATTSCGVCNRALDANLSSAAVESRRQSSTRTRAACRPCRQTQQTSRGRALS